MKMNKPLFFAALLLALPLYAEENSLPNVTTAVKADATTGTGLPVHTEEISIPNRLIDYPGFLKNAQEVAFLRAQRRVTEEQFIAMSKEPGTVVLDARSDNKYALLHVKGARHLDLTEFTADTVAKVIPDKNTRILIYCNNNFLNEPTALASKSAVTSLNIYTFNTLYGYGYQNIYELGPLLDIKLTKIPFEGTEIAPATATADNAAAVSAGASLN